MRHYICSDRYQKCEKIGQRVHLLSREIRGVNRKPIIPLFSPKRYRKCQEPDFPTEERLRLSTTSQSRRKLLASSPSRGASGEEEKFSAMPKPPLGRGGGSASALTERLSPAVAHGQAPLRTTSQSASQTAPLVGEPLAKPFTLRGLPKPLPLGEVAPKVTERASPARKSRRGRDRQAFCQSDTIAVPVILGQRPSPLSLVASSSPAPPKGEPLGALSSEACLRALREFVENARLKRKEFVNVIKMRRRY